MGISKQKSVVNMFDIKVDETKLWHHKLGHINFESMRNIISEDVIKGLLKLKIEEGKLCGECQIGKQTKISHKKLQHLATTKFLELLHMDLRGMCKLKVWVGKDRSLCVWMISQGLLG